MANLYHRTVRGQMPPPTGEVTSLIRTPLEPSLYRLAFDHACRAEVECNQGEPGFVENPEFEHSLISIILAATCLESFINFLGRKTYGVLWESDEGGNSRNGKRFLTVEDKWVEITSQEANGKTFDKSKKPFQDFKKLVQLRNYIIHYDASFSLPQPTHQTNLSEARAKINHSSANDAVKTMKAMIEEFFKLIGDSPPDWVT